MYNVSGRAVLYIDSYSRLYSESNVTDVFFQKSRNAKEMYSKMCDLANGSMEKHTVVRIIIV